MAANGKEAEYLHCFACWRLEFRPTDVEIVNEEISVPISGEKIDDIKIQMRERNFSPLMLCSDERHLRGERSNQHFLLDPLPYEPSTNKKVSSLRHFLVLGTYERQTDGRVDHT